DVPARPGVGDRVVPHDVVLRGETGAVAGEDDATLVGVDHVVLDQGPVRVRVEVHRPAARVVDEQVVADDRVHATHDVDEVVVLAGAPALVNAVALDERVGDLAIRADQHAADVASRGDVVPDHRDRVRLD